MFSPRNLVLVNGDRVPNKIIWNSLDSLEDCTDAKKNDPCKSLAILVRRNEL